MIGRLGFVMLCSLANYYLLTPFRAIPMILQTTSSRASDKLAMPVLSLKAYIISLPQFKSV